MQRSYGALEAHNLDRDLNSTTPNRLNNHVGHLGPMFFFFLTHGEKKTSTLKVMVLQKVRNEYLRFGGYVYISDI
jgi:hypothetical protein